MVFFTGEGIDGGNDPGPLFRRRVLGVLKDGSLVDFLLRSVSFDKFVVGKTVNRPNRSWRRESLTLLKVLIRRPSFPPTRLSV